MPGRLARLDRLDAHKNLMILQNRKNMTKRGKIGLAIAVILGGTSLAQTWAAAAEPTFQEVYELLRTNAAGLNETDLNQAAVEGLLLKLRGRAVLVTNPASGKAETPVPLLSKSCVYDDAYAYVRLSRLDAGAAEEFDKALSQLSSSNKLRGLVLDVRFADGQDYAAAGAVADRFFSSERTLLDWGTAQAKSKDKTNAWRMPVAVLVNRQTTGAAEALAAILQKNEIALLVGANTPGAAGVMKDFKLQNGQTLRIAVASLKLGEGEPLSAKGLTADISMTLPPEEEKRLMDEPSRTPGRTTARAGSTGTNALAGTNRPGRINEAELVRRMKEGLSPEPDMLWLLTAAAAEPDRSGLRDPALLRALDLLKGLAVVYGKKL